MSLRLSPEVILLILARYLRRFHKLAGLRFVNASTRNMTKKAAPYSWLEYGAFLAGQFAAVGRKQASRNCRAATLLCHKESITCSIYRCSTDISRPALELRPANRQAVSIWNSKLTPYRLFLRFEFRGPHALSTWRRRPAAGTLFRCYR